MWSEIAADFDHKCGTSKVHYPPSPPYLHEIWFSVSDVVTIFESYSEPTPRDLSPQILV